MSKQNAMGPAFQGLFSDHPILPHKPWPPVMAYTSTPFRGLERLLQGHASYPHARSRALACASSPAWPPTTKTPALTSYQALYERCAVTGGVEYVGALNQLDLDRAIKHVNLLFYPNTLPETSCIAVMEAMAADCLLVTSCL